MIRQLSLLLVVSSTLALPCVSVPVCRATEVESKIQITRDDAHGTCWIAIDGKRAFCYRYGDQVDLAHFFPINSPDGQSMTVQQTEPYPHHRSFWFGDRVALNGQRKVATYSALNSGVKGAEGKFHPPFRDGSVGVF